MIIHDLLNHNLNAVVYHAHRELEIEICKIAPEGSCISQAQQIKAIVSLNSVIPMKDKLTAYKIQTASSSSPGDNIALNDGKLQTRAA